MQVVEDGLKFDTQQKGKVQPDQRHVMSSDDHEDAVVWEPKEANDQQAKTIHRQFCQYLIQHRRKRLPFVGQEDARNGGNQERDRYCGHIVGNRAHADGSLQGVCPLMVAIKDAAQEPAQDVKEEQDALG